LLGDKTIRAGCCIISASKEKAEMTGARSQSLTCPVMIGREAQRGQLLEQLELAGTGRGQLATVSGEAGVGKSRLVAEVIRQAASAGFRVVQARCYETERSIPYGPLLGLIHHQLTLHSVAEMRAELGEAANELGQLAPALRASPAVATGLPDPETDKQRLGQALLRLVAGLPATTAGAPQQLHRRLLAL
jgi:predicted ATPase